MVTTTTHEVQTSGQGDAKDITSIVTKELAKSNLREGIATVAVVGSTAGVTTVEFEDGAVSDMAAMFERIAPRQGEYKHHLKWGDDNGSSHLRAALLGPSVTLPFNDSKLRIGTWQQIVVVEFDTQARRRQIVVQLMGE